MSRFIMLVLLPQFGTVITALVTSVLLLNAGPVSTGIGVWNLPVWKICLGLTSHTQINSALPSLCG